MSVTDILTLIGILVVLLTTIASWKSTRRTQESILEKQTEAASELAMLEHRLSTDREIRARFLNDGLSALTEMDQWFQIGRQVYLQAVQLEIERGSSLSEKDSKQIHQLYEGIGLIRSKAPRLLYLAKIHDPQTESAPKWQWGTEPFPSDLYQIINAFEDEVVDQFFQAMQGEKERGRPFVAGQFEAIHEAAIRALDRVKKSIGEISQA